MQIVRYLKFVCFKKLNKRMSSFFLKSIAENLKVLKLIFKVTILLILQLLNFV